MSQQHFVSAQMFIALIQQAVYIKMITSERNFQECAVHTGHHVYLDLCCYSCAVFMCHIKMKFLQCSVSLFTRASSVCISQ